MGNVEVEDDIVVVVDIKVDDVVVVVGGVVVVVEGAHSAIEGKFEPVLPVQSLSMEFNIWQEDVVSKDSKTQ